jgi:hypothetical protein
VLAARRAREQSSLQIRTDNDWHNAPILAINRKVEYKAQAGKYVLARWPGTADVRGSAKEIKWKNAAIMGKKMGN